METQELISSRSYQIPILDTDSSSNDLVKRLITAINESLPEPLPLEYDDLDLTRVYFGDEYTIRLWDIRQEDMNMKFRISVFKHQ